MNAVKFSGSLRYETEFIIEVGYGGTSSARSQAFKANAHQPTHYLAEEIAKHWNISKPPFMAKNTYPYEEVVVFLSDDVSAIWVTSEHCQFRMTKQYKDLGRGIWARLQPAP